MDKWESLHVEVEGATVPRWGKLLFVVCDVLRDTIFIGEQGEMGLNTIKWINMSNNVAWAVPLRVVSHYGW